jgi:ubiquinone biosynthesis protein
MVSEGFVRFAHLFFRTVLIAFVFAVALTRYGVRRLRGEGRTPGDRDRLRGAVLAVALERLGATFVKFGQILATRPDIVPEGIAQSLARLQDAVPAAPFAAVRSVLEADLGAPLLARFRTLDEAPVAAASVAQVHKGELDDGRVVAVKVQRPEAALQIERDLALLQVAARLLSALPGMGYVSLPGAAAEFAEALRAQLDFVREAENNRRLAKNFAHEPRVGVPALVEELCGPRVITMQFIDGQKPTEIREDRPALAQAGFRCIAQMVFVDGFVHADMHPGNLMFGRDGRIYLIDLGLVAEIPEDMRKPWVDTFVAVATADGARAAELFYGYAPYVGNTDYDAFERDVMAHLARLKGQSLDELEVTEAVGGAFSILRRHEVAVDPVFTVVNLAMLVAEGVGKQLDPKFDVYACVMPFLAEASMRYPTGKAMRRRPPRASSAEVEVHAA